MTTTTYNPPNGNALIACRAIGKEQYVVVVHCARET